MLSVDREGEKSELRGFWEIGLFIFCQESEERIDTSLMSAG